MPRKAIVQIYTIQIPDSASYFPKRRGQCHEFHLNQSPAKNVVTLNLNLYSSSQIILVN